MQAASKPKTDRIFTLRIRKLTKTWYPPRVNQPISCEQSEMSEMNLQKNESK